MGPYWYRLISELSEERTWTLEIQVWEVVIRGIRRPLCVTVAGNGLVAGRDHLGVPRYQDGREH